MAPSRDNVLCLLTLNTHSLMNGDDQACLRELARFIVREHVDVAAFQEVNQEMNQEPEESGKLDGYVPNESGHPIRCGNYALQLSRELKRLGGPFHWALGFAHVGYGRFEEGSALFSRRPILETHTHDISAPPKEGVRLIRRKMLGIQTGPGPAWFWCFHMGWWDDQKDPFREQWTRAQQLLRQYPGPVWLLGDFNSPSDRRGEGYDAVTASGYRDCYLRALEKDGGDTAPGQIDGWRKAGTGAMRLDLILSGQEGKTILSRTVFTGDREPVISDHFGVLDVEEMPETGKE